MASKKIIFVIIFLSISLIASMFLVLRTTVFFGKATSSNSSPIVLENSYLFASPIQAKADGKEKIRITAFLLDGQGLGISNLKVSLQLPQNVSVLAIQSVTDDTGKAVFDLSSSVAKQLDIAAQVNNKTIPQKVKIVFY
ncbi:MAG: Ig-like domain-containing protein [Candidatus Shapirobacteria bacterium]|nr:Ig-like domain-containing protein [Candidatus Shapirobacteria bacterium]